METFVFSLYSGRKSNGKFWQRTLCWHGAFASCRLLKSAFPLSEWLICIKYALFTSVEDDVGAGIWIRKCEWLPPHIDLFVLVEWQVLYPDRVSFNCLCVWSEPTLSSLSVRFCAGFLLMNGSARHRSSENPCLCCLPPQWISAGLQRLFITRLFRFLNVRFEGEGPKGAVVGSLFWYN